MLYGSQYVFLARQHWGHVFIPVSSLNLNPHQNDPESKPGRPALFSESLWLTQRRGGVGMILTSVPLFPHPASTWRPSSEPPLISRALVLPGPSGREGCKPGLHPGTRPTEPQRLPALPALPPPPHTQPGAQAQRGSSPALVPRGSPGPQNTRSGQLTDPSGTRTPQSILLPPSSSFGANRAEPSHKTGWSSETAAP